MFDILHHNLSRSFMIPEFHVWKKWGFFFGKIQKKKMLKQSSILCSRCMSLGWAARVSETRPASVNKQHLLTTCSHSHLTCIWIHFLLQWYLHTDRKTKSCLLIWSGFVERPTITPQKHAIIFSFNTEYMRELEALVLQQLGICSLFTFQNLGHGFRR